MWADTPERLYGLAAEALLAQIALVPAAETEVRIQLSLSADDSRDLLVHWLNTVLLQAELERAVWTKALVRSLTTCSIEATLEGPFLDRSRQELLREVKAVSHHDLVLVLDPGRCRCRMILDI